MSHTVPQPRMSYASKVDEVMVTRQHLIRDGIAMFGRAATRELLAGRAVSVELTDGLTKNDVYRYMCTLQKHLRTHGPINLDGSL